MEKADSIEGVWRAGFFKKHVSNMKYLRSITCILGVNTVLLKKQKSSERRGQEIRVCKEHNFPHMYLKEGIYLCGSGIC